MVNKISRLVQKFNIITGNGSLLAVRVYLGYAIDGGYSGDREFVTMRWMDRPVSARPDELRWSVIRNVLHWLTGHKRYYQVKEPLFFWNHSS